MRDISRWKCTHECIRLIIYEDGRSVLALKRKQRENED